MVESSSGAAKRRQGRGFTGGIGGDAQIRTPCGPRRAEMVRAGDLIVTRDNGLQPVRMVWKRKLTRAEMTGDGSAAPVRLKPRAVGPMMPVRDLLVAADHRVLVPGYRLSNADERSSHLVRAGDLVGVSDSVYADRGAIGADLYTFIFDTHQVFCASGLPVESFLPTPSTMSNLTGKLRSELVSLFPALRKDPQAYPAAKIPAATGLAFRADPA